MVVFGVGEIADPTLGLIRAPCPEYHRNRSAGCPDSMGIALENRVEPFDQGRPKNVGILAHRSRRAGQTLTDHLLSGGMSCCKTLGGQQQELGTHGIDDGLLARSPGSLAYPEVFKSLVLKLGELSL
jgi:hypothetical protein